MKKAWEKPELEVLMRLKPDEAVLTTCKESTSTGPTGTPVGACMVASCQGPVAS